VPKADPPLAENCHRCGSPIPSAFGGATWQAAAFGIFRGGLLSPREIGEAASSWGENGSHYFKNAGFRKQVSLRFAHFLI